MMESKEVHKGIFQIEWEHKKMEMEMEDLNQKAWDIQMLFFSKDRQKVNSPCAPLYNFNLSLMYSLIQPIFNKMLCDVKHSLCIVFHNVTVDSVSSLVYICCLWFFMTQSVV